jgi:hypothetical protein
LTFAPSAPFWEVRYQAQRSAASTIRTIHDLYKGEFKWLRKIAQTVAGGLSMITILDHFQGGSGVGISTFAPGGKATSQLFPRKKRLIWLSSINSKNITSIEAQIL